MLYTDPALFLSELERRLAENHRLICADDPSFKGPWYAPTEYPKIGYSDLEDEEWLAIEIPKLRGMSSSDATKLNAIRDTVRSNQEETLKSLEETLRG